MIEQSSIFLFNQIYCIIQAQRPPSQTIAGPGTAAAIQQPTGAFN